MLRGLNASAYSSCSSQEEYADFKTLEARLTVLAKRGARNHQQQAQQQQALQQQALAQQMANSLPGAANPSYAVPSGAMPSQMAQMYMSNQGLAAQNMAQFAVQHGAMPGYQKSGFSMQSFQPIGSSASMLPAQGMMMPDQSVVGSPGANGFHHQQSGLVRMQPGAGLMQNGTQVMMRQQRGNEWMAGQPNMMVRLLLLLFVLFRLTSQ